MSTAPNTLEGAFMLHLLYRVDWRRLEPRLPEVQKELVERLEPLLQRGQQDEAGGAFRTLGHKGDLMLLFLRRTPEELVACEQAVASLQLFDYLTPTWSYLSVVELSLHGGGGDNPEKLAQSMRPRLYPELPATRYVCFYPMNKKRGETKNWFMLTQEERAQMMVSHGKIGRSYAGRVTQIISSSVGLDDYDWGVDLFSDDAVAFKKLIYEMRFDEVSAVYAEFGPFLLGVRTPVAELLSAEPARSGAPARG